MPFQKHVHWGPDKMDIASNGNGEPQTRFTPQWVGALMLGPLVMATPDIHSWSDADFRLSPSLKELAVKHSPLALSLPSGRSGGGLFFPDYTHTDHCTHYLRLEIGQKTKGKGQKTGKNNDKQELSQLMQMARERQNDAKAWASHGYKRMIEAMQQQDAAALKTALATMRPSNLAEPEDLTELLALLTKARQLANKSEAQRDAIQYADMVVQYVNDGSGTHDLIQKATLQLQPLIP